MSDRFFNLADWEARAIVDGRKTVLRRPLASKPPCDAGDTLIGRECWRFSGSRIAYRADDLHPEEHLGQWCSASQMARCAARIVRKVLSVRIERLQDIDEADAVREGHEADPVHGKWVLAGRETHWSARKPFAEEWDVRYAKRGIEWGANPWVWRVEFGGPA